MARWRFRISLLLAFALVALLTPSAAASATGDKSVAAAHFSGAAAPKAGVFGWGWGGYGQLGNGKYGFAYEPEPVKTSGALAGKTVTAIEGGDMFSCAIASGKPYCWGAGPLGSLGVGVVKDPPSEALPVSIDGALAGKTVTDLSVGHDQACVVASGLAYCWGSNNFGLLGIGVSSDQLPYSATPLPVDTSGVLAGKVIEKISVGIQNTCVIAGGAVYCWGRNDEGALGNGTFDSSSVPVAVDASGALAGKTVTDVAVGPLNVCVVASGGLFCWGTPSGVPNDSNRGGWYDVAPVPADPDGLLYGKIVTEVSYAQHGACAIADGRPYCWGENGYSRGSGENVFSTEVTEVDRSGVLSGTKATNLTLGRGFACVLASGTPVCWGTNKAGQLGIGSAVTASLPVAVKRSGAMAGRTVNVIGAGSYSNQVFALTDIGATPAAPPLQPTPAAKRGILVGNVDTVVSFGNSADMIGWAADPDHPSTPLVIRVTDTRPDGVTVTTTTTARLGRPDVAAALPWLSAAHGFDVHVPLAGRGQHLICGTSLTAGRATDRPMGCYQVTLSAPFGTLDDATQSNSNTISVRGWLGDPERPTLPTKLRITVSGPNGFAAQDGFVTGDQRGDVGLVFPAIGGAAGFSATVSAQGVGDNVICAWAIGGVAAQVDTLVACRTVRVVNSWGTIDEFSMSAGFPQFRGWAVDPTEPLRSINTVLTVDGQFHSDDIADGRRDDVAAVFPAFGPAHGYLLTATDLSPGSHTLCVYTAKKANFDPPLIGCRTVVIG